MAVPDVSTLTEAELAETARLASERLSAIQNTEQINRDRLLDEAEIRRQITALEAAVVEINTMVGSMQGQSVDKTTLQIVRRLCQNMLRVLRVMAGALETANVGDGAV